MSKTRINGLSIEEVSQVVACSFLRVIKTYHHYETFKKAFKQFNPYGRDPLDGMDRHAPTSNTMHDQSKFGRLMSRITDVAMKDLTHAPQRGDKYNEITMIINALLRHTLEKNGVPMQQLGLLGQEIFDMTCYQIYGEEYLNEMDSLNEGAPRPTNEVEALLVSEFMARWQNGEHLSWEDFYRNNYDRVRDIIESHQQQQWTPNFDDDLWEWDEDEDDTEF